MRVYIILLTFALMIRLLHLNVPDIWVDEFLTVKLTGNSFFETMEITARLNQTDPPLMPFIMHFIKNTGSIASLRIFPCITAFLSLVLFYFYLKKSEKKYIFPALLLLCFSPLHLYISQELRYHALLIFCVLLNFIAFEQIRISEKLSWFWFISAALLLNTSYIGAGVIAAQILYFYKNPRIIFQIAGASLLIYIPWFVFFSQYGSAPQDSWILNSFHLHFSRLYASTVHILLGLFSGFSFKYLPFTVFWALLILLLNACIHSYKKNPHLLLYGFIPWFLLILANITVFDKPPIRHSVIFAPFIIIIVAAYLTDRKKTTAFLFILFLQIFGIINYFYNPDQQQNGFSEQCNLLSAINHQNYPVRTDEYDADFVDYQLKTRGIQLNTETTLPDTFFLINCRNSDRYPQQAYEKKGYTTLFSFPLEYYGAAEKCMHVPSVHLFSKMPTDIKPYLLSVSFENFFPSPKTVIINQKTARKNNTNFSEMIKSEKNISLIVSDTLYQIQKRIQPVTVSNYSPYIENQIGFTLAHRFFFLLSPAVTFFFVLVSSAVILFELKTLLKYAGITPLRIF